MQPDICYISIEDDFCDQAVLSEYARDFPFLIEKGTYSASDEGLAAIIAQKPDLVFLDIEMSGMTGIEVLRLIRQQVSLAVFITSHAEYALDGFELFAFDYILKPLTKERFRETAMRLQDYWSMRQKAAAYEVLFEREFLVIKEGHSQVKLPMHEIVYLEAMQDYTKVVTEKKIYLTLVTLSAFLEKLPISKFMRVHRSYAIALQKIKEYHPHKLVCGNTDIPIGKTYKNIVSQMKL